MEENSRIGTFSSSAISALVTNGKEKGIFGAPFYTYVEEKVYEYRLGKELQSESNAKPLTWGRYLEQFAFERLPLDYKLESKIRLSHPTIERWTGSPDIIHSKFTGDIKCPYTLKSYCVLVSLLIDNASQDISKLLRNSKEKSHKDYYWQAVSNGILTNKDVAKLILFMPYFDELEEIQSRVESWKGYDMDKYYWIWADQPENLPSLIRGNYYKNLYEFEFEIPKKDKQFLTERVISANSEFDRIIGK